MPSEGRCVGGVGRQANVSVQIIIHGPASLTDILNGCRRAALDWSRNWVGARCTTSRNNEWRYRAAALGLSRAAISKMRERLDYEDPKEQRDD